VHGHRQLRGVLEVVKDGQLHVIGKGLDLPGQDERGDLLIDAEGGKIRTREEVQHDP